MFINVRYRNKADNCVFFYFGDKASNREEREFYKHYEYNLNLDLVPDDIFLNSISHQGTLDLHEILYHIQPYNFEYAFALRPGFEFYKDWHLSILEEMKYLKLDNKWKQKDGEKPWSFIRGNHDHFYIINPIQNHIFFDNNPDTWVAKSEAEGCEVIDANIRSLEQISNEEWKPNFGNIEGMVYNDNDYKFQTLSTYKSVDKKDQVTFFNYIRTNPDMQLYSNTKMTAQDKIDLFQTPRKTIIYHSIYEKSFKTEIDKFEEKIKFNEFEDMLELDIPEDCVILLGGLPSFKFMGNVMTYDQAVEFSTRITTRPKTSVWAKCLHTDQEIFIND